MSAVARGRVEQVLRVGVLQTELSAPGGWAPGASRVWIADVASAGGLEPGGALRWDGLFADLEAQAAALEQTQRGAEVEERTRGEVGALSLVDRARAAVGSPLRLRLTAGLAVSAALRRVGPDWLLLDEGAGREMVVATAHVLAIRGLGRLSAAPDLVGIVESRLGLRHVLRGIARDRSAVRVHLADGSTLDATLDRVGGDFVEVAAHPAGEARRRQQVREVELVPLAALVAVRRSG